jgi:citrate synthase
MFTVVLLDVYQGGLQWKEMRENKEPIGRPRQIYTGSPLRDFKTVDKR